MRRPGKRADDRSLAKNCIIFKRRIVHRLQKAYRESAVHGVGQERTFMSRRWIAVVFLFSLMTISAVAARQGAKPAAGSASGWTLPPEAQTTKSPLTVDPKLLATGKSIFKE